jgi:hypothetical protein
MKASDERGAAEFASNVNWSRATFYCRIYFLVLLTADAGRKIHRDGEQMKAAAVDVCVPSFACLALSSIMLAHALSVPSFWKSNHYFFTCKSNLIHFVST